MKFAAALPVARVDDEVGRRVEHDTRRGSARNVHRLRSRRRSDHRDAPGDAAAVQRRDVGAVVGDPQRRRRAGGLAPRVDEVRVGDPSDPGDVRDQVRLLVLTGGRIRRRCDRYCHRRDGRDDGQCAAHPQAFALTESRGTNTHAHVCCTHRPTSIVRATELARGQAGPSPALLLMTRRGREPSRARLRPGALSAPTSASPRALKPASPSPCAAGQHQSGPTHPTASSASSMVGLDAPFSSAPAVLGQRSATGRRGRTAPAHGARSDARQALHGGAQATWSSSIQPVSGAEHGTRSPAHAEQKIGSRHSQHVRRDSGRDGHRERSA